MASRGAEGYIRRRPERPDKAAGIGAAGIGNEMLALVAVQGLTKRFDAHVVVDRVDLEVGVGEVLGFLGPNGAGKSTTMKMIAGFLAPTEGRAAICGHDVTEDPIRAKRNLGYLPEGAPLYGDMTAGAFLAFVAAVRGLSGRRGRAAVGLAVERTDIADVLAQPIDTLSKGFKRRVGLAQALLHDPPVLILDEPTDGLDPNQKHEMRALIREIRPSKAIVISTHILEEVDAVCTRAAIISGGRLLADASPADLAAWSPLHNAVSLTLGARFADAAAASLGGLERVETVEREPAGPDTVRLRAISRDGGPIFADVGLLVQAHGWEVNDLRTETGALDDVFRRMTQPDGEAA